MPTYQVMRESFQTDQGYLPGVVWLYDGQQIRLGALPSYDPERASIQDRLDDALARGFHVDDVWSYWRDQAGQHQLSQRSRPVRLVARNAQEAMDAALASMYEPELS